MSESLREKGIRPGPGIPPEETAQNQRERLFGAIVASVSERGYAATRVADLARLSGVSSKSFYRLFADKKACFLAAMDAMVSTGIALASTPGDATAGDPYGTWEEQLKGINLVFAEMVVAQPAAARMLLLHAHAAGPEALERLAGAAAGLEWLAKKRIEQHYPDMAGLPSEIVTGMVTAVQEIARTRLRTGDENGLPRQVPDIARVIASWVPPPEPLRLTTRPPAFAPETLDAHERSERALRAFTAVVAERGYSATSISQVVKRASVSQTTFYAHFRDKEDALMAAIDSAGAQIVAAILPAFRRNPDRMQGVRSAFGAFFNFLASRPALARLMMVEVYAAGPAALGRRAEALRPLEGVLVAGRVVAPEVSPVASELVLGAVFGLAYKRVQSEGPEALPGLAAVCTYMALAPFVGADSACAAANGNGLAKPELESPAVSGGLALEPEHRTLLKLIGEGFCDAETISRRIGASVEMVQHQLDELVAETMIYARAEEGGKQTYKLGLAWIDEDVWFSMDQVTREEVSGRIIDLIAEEVRRAREARTFDGRPDRFLSRSGGAVDEEGWAKLLKIHHAALLASVEAEREAAERLEKGKGRSIQARTLQALFEMPEGLED